MHASTFGDSVPAGNGDDPAVGQANRIYVRVRNLGTTDASNVVVHVDRTDPEGRGIAGSNGFVNIDSTTIPSIPAGGFVDTFVTYTPSFTPTAAQLADGRFQFHTCVRVRIDAVSNELVLGNQDGDGEQENIDYFEAPPAPGPGAPRYRDSFLLRNDDPAKPRFFNLSYLADVPARWAVRVNGGKLNLTLKGGEARRIPVVIRPARSGPRLKAGAVYHVDVLAQYERQLVNKRLPPLHRKHEEITPLGGVRFEARIVTPARLTCRAQRAAPGSPRILVTGLLKTTRSRGRRPVVLVEGAHAKPLRLIRQGGRLARVRPSGAFRATVTPRSKLTADRVVCLYAGTRTIASASSGLVAIR
jgi:hypothetical protein